MEGVDHVHVVEVGGGGLVGQIHRMLQRQVPDGEGLIFGVACANAPLIFVVKLAEAGGHFAAAGAGRRDHHDGAAGLDVVIFAQALVGHDVRHVRGIAGDGVVLVALHAQRRQALDEGVSGRLASVLGDDHGADVEAKTPEHVRQAQHVVVVADAQIAPHFALFDVAGADGNDDLHLVLHGGQHADLAVGLEAGQHPRGVVVVKELAAELQIQLVAELAAALLDVLGLQGQILVVVESDLHVRCPSLASLFKK